MPPRPALALILACAAAGLAVLAALMLTGGRPTPPPLLIPVAVPPRAEALVVYKPVTSHFQAAYHQDERNRQHQTWDSYWGWVRVYYEGNILANGWVKETNTSLAVVTDPAMRAELLREMNEAGQLASREWAKDKQIRRITTADLQSWGNRLAAARGEETGSGTKLLSTVRLIHGEVKTKLAPPTDPPPAH